MASTPSHRTPILFSRAWFLSSFAVMAAWAAGPPAGQMCPSGAYVIGFDEDGNIVCSDIPDQHIVEAAAVPAASVAAAAAVTPAAAASTPPAAMASSAAPVVLSVTDVDPYSVVFGKRQHTVTITGTGFSDATVVVFQAESYTPTVNATGTQLEVTLDTSGLPIGRYGLKVVNGPGQEVVRKGAIAVF